MAETPSDKWNRIGVYVAIAATVSATLIGLGAWLYPNPSPPGMRDGALVIPTVDRSAGEPSFAPYGDGLPTAVFAQNTRDEESLIQAVTFHVTGHRATPQRQPIHGIGETVEAFYTARHYDAGTNSFHLRLPKPISSPPGEWSPIEVAIIEPDWLGNTYRGTLTVHYNNNQQVSVPDVEVDVIPRRPQPRP